MRTRRSKYGNRKCEVDGITFDSQKEARRYQELRLLERAGEIRDLQRQVVYKLQCNDVNLGVYRADFVYQQPMGLTPELWLTTVEDVKGVRTPIYRLKKRLMFACHRIDILET